MHVNVEGRVLLMKKVGGSTGRGSRTNRRRRGNGRWLRRVSHISKSTVHRVNTALVAGDAQTTVTLIRQIAIMLVFFFV